MKNHNIFFHTLILLILFFSISTTSFSQTTDPVDVAIQVSLENDMVNASGTNP